MAKLIYSCLFAAAVVFISCSTPQQQDTHRLDYELRNINYQSGNCEPERDACLMVKMEYPHFVSGDSTARSKANMIIRNSTLDFLGMGDVEAKTTPELEVAVVNLDSSFQRLKREFGSPAGWMAELHTSELYRNDSLIILEVNTASYFGGAHGQYNTRYFNFDRSNGQMMMLADFVEIASFTVTAEQFFKEKYVKDGESYAEAGFSFYDGKFKLAANFSFKGDSILLHYNHYEIASYADGQFDVAVPLL